MRSSKSRPRNNKNRNRSVGNVINRVFDSSGPEGKVRGTPQQIIEKYNQLARDAQLVGDLVATEAFQQHAEHYTRLLAAAQKEIDAKREQQEQQHRERQQNRQGGEQGGNTQEAGQSGNNRRGGHQRDEQPQPVEAASDDAGLVATPEAVGEPSLAPEAALDAPQPDLDTPAPRKPRNRRTRAKAPASEPSSSEPSKETAPAEASGE